VHIVRGILAADDWRAVGDEGEAYIDKGARMTKPLQCLLSCISLWRAYPRSASLCGVTNKRMVTATPGSSTARFSQGQAQKSKRQNETVNPGPNAINR
jgi:hypothetical protein